MLFLAVKVKSKTYPSGMMFLIYFWYRIFQLIQPIHPSRFLEANDCSANDDSGNNGSCNQLRVVRRRRP